MASTHLLRIDQVIEQTARSRASIYADIKKGTFPPPVKIGPRSSRWREDEVQTWIDNLPTAQIDTTK
ncbi:MAG: AlpA family phage regulatory protein [Sedimenticola sp.]